MKCKVAGAVMQTLNCELKKDESLIAEAGSMSWMSENIGFETVMKGGLVKGIKRKLSGESFFLNKFTCKEGNGIITFSNEFPGTIIPLTLTKGKHYICQRDAFLCGESTVHLDLLFTRVGFGLFGGEGILLQRLYGKGKTWLSVPGEVTRYYLKPNQKLRVDTGHIACFESTVKYDFEFVKGLRNILFGGEGLFLATLQGPGYVWLQSMTLADLSDKVLQFFMRKRKRVFER